MGAAMNIQQSRAGGTAFERLAWSIGCKRGEQIGRSFDLVFEDDIPATVSLQANGRDVGVQVWCRDASMLIGAPRRSVLKTLLLLNQATQTGQALCVGLDSRDFIVLSGCQRMDDLDGETLARWLAWLVAQARRIRSLVHTLEDSAIEFSS